MNRIRHLFNGLLLGAGLVMCGGPVACLGATSNVTVGSGGNVFSPASVSIAVNDSVLWTWAGSPHNVTSTNNAWVASPTQGTGTKFTNTFNAAGTYFYYCTIHGTPTSGMKGAVVVTAPNVPPTVSLTNPVSGTVFATPADITLRAAAADSDGSVTNVQFRVDSILLTNDNTAPYSAVTNNLAVGTHMLTAIASDNNGATATNQISISVVTPVATLLSASQVLPPGKFRFTYSANTGLNYIVQRSTNLLSPNWTPLITNQALSGSINFTDQNSTFNPAFYRIGRLPNP